MVALRRQRAGAFDGPADYAANSVWDLAWPDPIRIDCGDSDPYAATKAFIAQLPNPPPAGSRRAA